MKIKYKLIILFTLIILFSSLPLSIFILNKQEADKISMLIHQGQINSKILTSSILNIILMNGGDLEAAKIDSREMISIFAPLTESGLVYADAILLSSKEDYNGYILGSYLNKENVDKNIVIPEKITADDVTRLKEISDYSEYYIEKFKDTCYEFSSTASLESDKPICIGRLIYSKSIVLKPIRRLRYIIYLAILLAILAVSFLAIYFSRFVTKPIDQLTSGVERIEAGDLNYKVIVSSKDEFSKLARTFNDMLKVLNLEITELVNTNKELTRLDNLKDEFLANISHEMRSPLYGTIGIAESLMGGAAGPINDELNHDLAMIVSSSKKLSRLIDDILDFSKLKHSDIKLKNVPVDLFAITKLVISYLRNSIEKKSLEIENLIIPEATFVFGDEDRIQQIMLYIISNSVKFTENGKISISASPYDKNDEMLVVSVSDTGVGIPEDKKDRIFELFEQADGSVSRTHGGAGLGLAISKKLVELHNGEIWVESELGKGTSIHFTLKSCSGPVQHFTRESNDLIEKIDPLDNYDNNIRSLNNKLSQTTENVKKILVVDDEPVNLQIMINHLTLEGYDVATSSSGDDALSKIEVDSFDLVLLDVMLPRMSGYEICRVIRKKYSIHQLPVLMLTVKNKPEDIVTGLEAGANDYLTKPFNKEELIARVNTLISLKTSIKIHDELNIIKRDIFIAHEIQQSLLPLEMPISENFVISAKYEPMYDLGGDFYEFQVNEKNKIGVLIADVSGHGIPAAFISAMLKVIYFFYKEEYKNPSSLMEKINKAMCNYTNSQFVTACYMYIDFDEMKLYQANAGHWPLVLWRESEKLLYKDKSKDVPIGWLPEATYETIETDIKSGDRIVLYTDGIVEVRKSNGDMLGGDNFFKSVKNNMNLKPEEFCDYILQLGREWGELDEGDSFKDDVTLIVMDIL